MSNLMGLKWKRKGTNTWFDMPDPTEMTFGYQDISDSEAGRDNNTGTMYKGLKGTCRTIGLIWQKDMTPENVSSILTMLSNEYILVQFHDPQTNVFQSSGVEFYAGDRSTAVRYWLAGKKRYTQIQVDLIERTPK